MRGGGGGREGLAAGGVCSLRGGRTGFKLKEKDVTLLTSVPLPLPTVRI